MFFLIEHCPAQVQTFYSSTTSGRLRVISVEGLSGFKLQGFMNDATRTRDLDDIRALLKMHHAWLNMDEVREYFALFNKPELLHELLGSHR